MRVLAIAGSVRADSHNLRLLRAAQRAAGEGVELELLDRLLLKEIPAFDGDDESAPPAAVEEFRTALAEADAILFATPEYNSSIPGVLKNALDWASRPFGESALTNKAVAVIGASTGRFGAVWAQAELRKVLAASGARVIEAEFALGQAGDAFGPEGELIELGAAESLRSVLASLVAELEPAHEHALAA